MLIILYLFIGFILIDHLFTFVFLYIEYGLGRLAQPATYPPVPIWHYIKNFIQELIYVTAKYYLYPLKFANLTTNLAILEHNKHPTVILLVHGYARSQIDWLWFKRQLASLPYPIYTMNLAPTFGPMQQIAENSLQTKIAEIKQATNCQQIILIGHSMGGLVCSYYSEFLDKENLVQKIIAIGTPWYGTKLSIVAAGANAKQMCPGTLFGEEIRAKINKSNKQYYEIATQFDNVVFPWQSAILKSIPATRQLILPFESHLGMLYSKVVVKQVREWLNPTLAP